MPFTSIQLPVIGAVVAERALSRRNNASNTRYCIACKANSYGPTSTRSLGSSAADIRIAIVGGGVIGLTTALRLVQTFPRCHLTIVAEKLASETTSEGAAGLWKPFALSSKQDPAVVFNWGAETFAHYMHLSQTDEAPRAGILRAPAYEIYKEVIPDPDWSRIVPGFRHLSSAELSLYDPSGSAEFGFAYETIIAEGRLYLPWLLDTIQKEIRGDFQIRRERVSRLSGLSEFDVVVNCTGLGARELVEDDQMYAIRGHVVRVKAPWVVHHVEGLVEDHDLPAYIIPNRDTVILGGTKVRGNEDTTPREEDRQAILDRCCKAMPSLAAAEIAGEWVGLRPGREDGVRIGVEHIQVENSSSMLPVIHNYGHGGSGLTLAWGCAGDVVELVKTTVG